VALLLLAAWLSEERIHESMNIFGWSRLLCWVFVRLGGEL
jgi:hypothetical protein